MADGEAGHGQVGMFLAAGKDLNIGIFSWSSSLCGRSQRAVLFRAMHVFMMRLECSEKQCGISDWRMGGSGITEKIDRADGQIKREKALQIPGIHIMIEKMKAECSLLPGRMSKGLRFEDRDR